MEVWDDAFVGIVAAVDVEELLVNDGDVIGAWGDVFAVYFDLGPAGVESVIQLGLDHDVGGFAIVVLVFLAFWWFFALHQL